MTRSLYFKLTLAFILVALLAAALVAVFIRFTSADRLTQFILDQQRSDLSQIVEDYYTTNGSWNGIQSVWRQIQPADAQPPGGRQSSDRGNPNGPTGRDRRSLFGLADAAGVVLVAFDQRFPPGTRLGGDLLSSGTQLNSNGKLIGYLLTSSQTPGFNPEESLFLERTNQALTFAMLSALLAAMLVGLFLARTLTRPLRALTEAAQGIAAGKLDQQVDVPSKDEIGRLAEAFNLMSQEVARVNQLRRQMTADIAHDLRTPLTVISGYVESMRDGVLKPTPDRLALIYTEIERLQRLVGDLRMLSQADAGELPLTLQSIQPAEVLQRAAALFAHRAEQQQVSLTVDNSKACPAIRADEARLMQVLGNLLSNALRFTPAGGRITLSAQPGKGKVELSVADTGAGISAEDLPYVFDRFYRGEKSRHSEEGESGLGLAIVRALVESQHGRVWAESAAGAGTTIRIELPAA